MYTCYTVFQNGRILAIVHTEWQAEALINILCKNGNSDIKEFDIEGRYHTGLGF